MSAWISLARRAGALSVVKYGLPVPAAKMTARPFSSWRMARRRMNGSATARGVVALADVDRRLHAGGHAPLLQGVLEGEGVDHRGEHAHVVAGHAVDAAVAGGEAPDDVAAADHHRHLDVELVDVADLVGDGGHHRLVDAERLRAHQGLAGDLEEDPAVPCRLSGLLSFHQRAAWAMTSAAKSSWRFSIPSPSL